MESEREQDGIEEQEKERLDDQGGNTDTKDDKDLQKKKKCLARIRLMAPHAFMFSMAIIYILLTTSILYALEGGWRTTTNGTTKVQKSNSNDQRKEADLNATIDKLWEYTRNSKVLMEDEWKTKMRSLINESGSLLNNYNEKKNATAADSSSISWSYFQCLLYMTASLTRIGSTVHPETLIGRLFVLSCVITGTHLILLCFTDLAKFITDLWVHFVKKIKRKSKKKSEEGGGDDDFEEYMTKMHIYSRSFLALILCSMILYAIGASLLIRVWCGGSVFGNIFNALLIVFAVGPAQIGQTEQCADMGAGFILSSLLIAVTAPVIFCLVFIQSDQFGVEFVRGLHRLMRRSNCCPNFGK